MGHDNKRQIGAILVQRQLLTATQLEDALRDQRRAAGVRPKPLASYLIEKGIIGELDALRALSEQQGVPGIDLTQVAILLEHLDVVPRAIADSHAILAVLVRGDRIFLAMSDPTDKRVIDELEFVTGKKVYPYVALRRAIEKTIAAAYDAKEHGETYYLGPNVPAETLRQLGLNPPSETYPSPPSVPENEQPVVLDTQMQTAGVEAEVSTTDFGKLEPDVLPVGKLVDESSPGSTGLRAARTEKLVLVVDDEDDIRKLLSRLLTDRGMRVIEADRGLVALRLVKEHVPDLIILDAMLPELHGFDIARRIKGSTKYGHIPIVMISAVYRGWRIAEDLKAGFGISEYLEKPFRIADAIAAVERALDEGDRKSGSLVPPEQISSEAEDALQQGISAYRLGNLDTAIEHLRRGVAIDPLAYRLHFHLGLLLGKQGLIYEGIQALERAVDLNARHFPALKNLAVLYEKAGFRHRAVEAWERASQAAPDATTRATIRQHLLKLL